MPDVVPPMGSGFRKRTRSAISRIGGRFSRLGSSTTARFLGTFLKRQVWAWPLIAAVILGVAGYFVHSTVKDAMRRQREDMLTTILNADVEGLRIWMDEQARNAEQLSDDDRMRVCVPGLLALADKPDAERALLQAPEQETIRSRLGPKLRAFKFVGFFIVSPKGKVLASEQDAAVGKALGGYREEFFLQVLQKGPSTSIPYRSPLLLQNERGELRANLPTMFAASPITNGAGEPVAVLGLRIRPEGEFTKILQVARAGSTGETYAFDREGLFLSNCRDDAKLKQLGLIPDLPEYQSVLTLQARDPGVNLAEGGRPTKSRQEQPLTHMVENAIHGKSGCNPDGYANYAGVPVVGAWTWLSDYDFGVAMEMEQAEAFAPFHILQSALWALMALLVLAAVGIFVAMLFMNRQQKMLQAAVSQATRLGQYTLEEKLGSGGMGTVYKARHSMLRRPTAIKLLDVEKVSQELIVRFEREVQTTSTLTHPNTIQIYDFGLTPEGIFYYVMELLEGADLDVLVQRSGPLPEARVAYLLRQACGSLAEAHAQGLVHRDVKPANLYLTRRGGMCDFVKVLDFGLVKSLGGKDDVNVTAANSVPGTPLYLSPEAATQPDKMDARADVYALGAVAYYLLTGQPVFDGNTVTDIVMKHVREEPQAPSKRTGRPITASLESLVLRCLAKAKADRPQDAGQLLFELDQCQLPETWNPAKAATWWFSHFPDLKGVTCSNLAGPSVPSTLSSTPDEVGQTIEYQKDAKFPS